MFQQCGTVSFSKLKHVFHSLGNLFQDVYYLTVDFGLVVETSFDSWFIACSSHKHVCSLKSGVGFRLNLFEVFVEEEGGMDVAGLVHAESDEGFHSVNMDYGAADTFAQAFAGFDGEED